MWAGSIQSIQGSKKWLLRRGLRPTSRGIRPNSEKTFWKTPGFFIRMTSGSVSKPCTPVVHIKIAGKWMFIPLKMVLTGIDPYPSLTSPIKPSGSSRCCSPKLAGRWIIRMPAPEYRNSPGAVGRRSSRGSQWFPPGRRSRGLYMFRISSPVASQVTIGLFPWQKIFKETLGFSAA